MVGIVSAYLSRHIVEALHCPHELDGRVIVSLSFCVLGCTCYNEHSVHGVKLSRYRVLFVMATYYRLVSTLLVK